MIDAEVRLHPAHFRQQIAAIFDSGADVFATFGIGGLRAGIGVGDEIVLGGVQ